MFNLAVYGTLRPGEHNNPMIPSSARHQGTARVPGFEMRIHNGWLPLAIPNPDQEITVDLYEIPEYSRRVFSIAEMEIGAGYAPASIIINDKPYILWVYVGTLKGTLKDDGDYSSST